MVWKDNSASQPVTLTSPQACDIVGWAQCLHIKWALRAQFLTRQSFWNDAAKSSIWWIFLSFFFDLFFLFFFPYVLQFKWKRNRRRGGFGSSAFPGLVLLMDSIWNYTWMIESEHPKERVKKIIYITVIRHYQMKR